MPRGRKPQPTALKLIRGFPGHHPRKENEYAPEPATPDCPDHLIGEAKKEWDRLTKEFAAVGLLSHVDRGLLALLCTAWGDHVEARRKMAEHATDDETGIFRISPNGFLVQSAWMAVSNKSLELYTKLAVEFGMSPSSRTRVAGGKPKPAEPKEKGWGQFG